MKVSLASFTLLTLSSLNTAFSAAVVPSDACVPIASKLLKEGIQFEVQTQVPLLFCLHSSWHGMRELIHFDLGLRQIALSIYKTLISNTRLRCRTDGRNV